MAAAAPLVVNDRATTPVAHTFTMRAKEPVPLFVETGSVPFGERKFTISTRKTAGKYRTVLKLENPTLVTEVVNGVNVPKVPRTAYAELRLTFDEFSSEQERADTVGMIANAMAASQTMMNATLVKLESIW